MIYRRCQWPNDLTIGVRLSECGCCGAVPVTPSKPYCAEHMLRAYQGKELTMQTFRVTEIRVGTTASAKTKVLGMDTLDRRVEFDLSPDEYAAFSEAGHVVGDWLTFDRERRQFAKAER